VLIRLFYQLSSIVQNHICLISRLDSDSTYLWMIVLMHSIGIISVTSSVYTERKKIDRSEWYIPAILAGKSFFTNFYWRLGSTLPWKFDRHNQFFVFFRMIPFLLNLHEVKIFESVDMMMSMIICYSFQWSEQGFKSHKCVVLAALAW
jgi:hypothetical protein